MTNQPDLEAAIECVESCGPCSSPTGCGPAKTLAAAVRSLQSQLKEMQDEWESHSCLDVAKGERRADYPSLRDRAEKAEREAADLRAKLSTAKEEGRREMEREVIERWWVDGPCRGFEKWLESQAKGE